MGGSSLCSPSLTPVVNESCSGRCGSLSIRSCLAKRIIVLTRRERNVRASLGVWRMSRRWHRRLGGRPGIDGGQRGDRPAWAEAGAKRWKAHVAEWVRKLYAKRKRRPVRSKRGRQLVH